MKAISITFEDLLLNEINEKSEVLKITRAEMIRNAILEYLFRFDEILDSKMLAKAVEKNESKRSLNEIAKELNLK